MPLRLAILGDFDPAMHTHVPLLPALQQVAGAQQLDAAWIPTNEIDLTVLQEMDGILLAPGSPYANFPGAIAAIELARTTGIPFLGICGGYQHTLIEYALHVLQLPDADSAEHQRPSQNLVIVPAPCRLDGRHRVHILPGTRLAAIYGDTNPKGETYFCGFEANPDYRARFEQAGLRLNAHADDGTPRGCELETHPFFLATAFQPQMQSDHPVIRAFVQAAEHRALGRAWTGIHPAHYAQHMENTGQAAANAALSGELLAPLDGGKLLIAGSGPGQMLAHGLNIDRFEVTFTDINPDFLEALRPHGRTLLDDLARSRLNETYAAALVVLVLEHLDWHAALANLARLAPRWFIIIQRNPEGMATAVTPGLQPPGTMQTFATAVLPHLIPEAELTAQARRHGYSVTRRFEAPVLHGKTMIGLDLKRPH